MARVRSVQQALTEHRLGARPIDATRSDQTVQNRPSGQGKLGMTSKTFQCSSMPLMTGSADLQSKKTQFRNYAKEIMILVALDYFVAIRIFLS